MSRIVVDPKLSKQFANLADPAEICDESGQVVAYAVTPEWHRRMIYDWALEQMPDLPDSAVEDYDKNGGMTTAELKEYMANINNLNPLPA